MTAKKVLRPYTREEVLATLGAKVSTAAPTARSFSPGGLSASSVFANRRAAITKGGERTIESAPAGRAKSAAVFTSNFAAGVFSARRSGRAQAASPLALKEPASLTRAAVDPAPVAEPRENGAVAVTATGSTIAHSALVEAEKDVNEPGSSFSYADLTTTSSARGLKDVVARACGFGGGD